MKVCILFVLLARQVNAVRKVVDMNNAVQAALHANAGSMNTGVQAALHSNADSMNTGVQAALHSNADSESDYGKVFEQFQEAAERHALSVLESLKEDPDNETLRSEYRNLVGEIEWASPTEEASFSESGASLLEEGQAEPLGEMAAPGQEYNLVELIEGFRQKLGRLFTNRRDYVVETTDGIGKWILKGNGLSMHSRIHVIDAEGNYKYVLRRSFNYLNPLAGGWGQYSYRVIQCKDTSDQLLGSRCSEGKVLYTITKDRLGRGLFWGHDEWRIFTGLGGCKKWSSGLFSCDKDKQIYYSLSSGIAKVNSYDTVYYQGSIRTMNGDTASMYDGSSVPPAKLENEYEVARSTQTEGPPRILNWANEYLFPGTMIKEVTWLAKGLVWHDSYHLTFTKPTDALLMILMQACQDITTDVRSQ